MRRTEQREAEITSSVQEGSRTHKSVQELVEWAINNLARLKKPKKPQKQTAE